MGKKVWIKRLSCPALPGAAGSGTEVADGCALLLWAKALLPSLLLAHRLSMGDSYSRCPTAQLH